MRRRAVSETQPVLACTLQVANEINSRRINDEYNVFSGLPTNNIFIGVIVITMGVQVSGG